MQTIRTAASNDTADNGRVRVGAAHRLLAPVAPPAPVADSGRVRVGAAHRILPVGRRG